MKNYTPAELKVMDDFADYRLHEGDRLLKEEAFEQAGEAYREALSLCQRLFRTQALESLHSVGACMGKLVEAALTRGDRETAVEWIRKMTPIMVCAALCSGEADTHRKAAKACVRQAIYEEDGWTTYRLYQQALAYYEEIPLGEYTRQDSIRTMEVLGELCLLALRLDERDDYRTYFDLWQELWVENCEVQ